MVLRRTLYQRACRRRLVAYIVSLIRAFRRAKDDRTHGRLPDMMMRLLGYGAGARSKSTDILNYVKILFQTEPKQAEGAQRGPKIGRRMPTRSLSLPLTLPLHSFPDIDLGTET